MGLWSYFEPFGTNYISEFIIKQKIQFNLMRPSLATKQNVSVLGREEGYKIKYGLSPRDYPRAVYPDLSPNTDIIPFLTMIY